MNHTQQPEFDDELLSAYLDGELSTDERARVEERLAADPAARTLLDHLRTVSHSVRSLPPRKLNADLRESVLSRAEQAMLTSRNAYPRIADEPESPHGGSTLPNVPLPPFSLGRTRRAWFWAGLTVAAALLIAFVQPEEDGEKVAVLSQPRRDVTRVGEVELRAIEPPATSDESLAANVLQRNAEPEDAAAMPAAPPSEVIVGEAFGGVPISTPAPMSISAPRAENTPTATTFADAPMPEGRAGYSLADEGKEADAPRQVPANDMARSESRQSTPALARGAVRSGGFGGSGAETVESPVEASAPPIENKDLVVVHVNTTPAAFKNKSFDQVLANSGITLEIAVSDGPENVRSARTRGQAEKESVDELSEDSGAAEANVELVLVEAQPAQITACLNTLNNDSANYLAVEVEQPSSDSSDRMKEQSLGLNWSQYSRGAVPEKQKAQFSLGYDWYFDKAPLNTEEATGPEGAQAASGKKIDASGSLGRAMRQDAEKLSRARRVRSLNSNLYGNIEQLAERSSDRSLGELDKSTATTDRFYGLKREEKGRAASEDQLQVLFVISPEETPATSPPATSSPQ